jgi:hypothetical protein
MKNNAERKKDRPHMEAINPLVTQLKKIVTKFAGTTLSGVGADD